MTSRSARYDSGTRALSTAGPRPAARAFDELTRDFFAVWLRYHPDAALAAGISDSADRLPPCSDDDQAALATWLQNLIVALQEFDAAELDLPRRIDLELMFALARVEHRELLERDWRHRDPLRHLPIAGIHRLTLLRPDGLRHALAARLAAMPDQLRLAQTQLAPTAELVPRMLAEAALAAIQDGRRYLRELVRSRWLRNHCHSQGELETLAEAAASALGYFGDNLAREIRPRAAGPLGCGPARLEFFLRQRHFVLVKPADCQALLHRLSAEAEARLAGVRRDLGDSAFEPLPARAGTARDVVRAECAALAERLEAEGIVTLPPAPLVVRGGPVCPRMAPAHVDYVPDLRRGEGILYVPDRNKGGETAAGGQSALRLACLHQGWGGAHLLDFAGGMAARSVPRRLASAATLTGGWALALDRRLFDTDAADADDRRLVLEHRVTAIEVARVDLDLHRGQLDGDAALDRLMGLGLDRPTALATLAGIAERPGNALAAVLGWRMLERVRPADSAARAFNDRLVGLGPIPLPLALRYAFGDDMARAAIAALCAPGSDEISR